MAGKGLGPLLGSGAHGISLCNDMPVGVASYGFKVVANLNTAFAVLTIGAVFFLQPNLDDIEDAMSRTRSASAKGESRYRLYLILAALVMTCVSSVAVSGVEVATALLLKKNYRWEPAQIGVIIAATFMHVQFMRIRCFPFRLYKGNKSSASV